MEKETVEQWKPSKTYERLFKDFREHFKNRTDFEFASVLIDYCHKELNMKKEDFNKLFNVLHINFD